MKQLGKIRRMFYREGLSISEISRRSFMSRNTIKRWLKAPDGAEPKYERVSAADTKIGPYADRLRQMLEQDARRIQRERRTAKKLHEVLQSEGFDGDYSRVTAFVRRWREDGGQTRVRGYVPLRFEPGEAYQFDWSEERLFVGGIWRKVQVAHLKLCFSRAFIVQAYPTQSHEMLFDAHTQAFSALGGIARRGIYDNMKTAVDKVLKGKERVVNTRFEAMLSYYLVEPEFCNVASGWEKGVVEKNVQDSRRRIWQDAQQQRFSSFTELNLWLMSRCHTLWESLRHAEHDATLAEMLEYEYPSLMPMIAPFDGYIETMGKVSSTSLVTEKRNRYSVPCEYVGQVVGIRIYPQRIDFVAHNTIVASHVRAFGRAETRYDWQHYIPLIERKPGALRNGAPFADMPAPLLKLRALLLRHEGGERTVAKVLAAVPRYGLDAVLVAVELVLESGNVSVEHVQNVLHRLSALPTPESVQTALTVKEAPIADTSRYDDLRMEASHGA
ncbi:MAG: IS21 family transposase [Burkholderiaceae bacterium]|jgi:transposase|nr:IS21 family transposase [Burkholderiaceae bacterium]